MDLAEFYGADHKGSVFGYSAEYGPGFHYGQDIKRHPVGTPIPALWGGLVMRSGFQAGHGYYVSIRREDGFHESHSHMHAPSPLVFGQMVSPGQTVGPLGSTGLSTGPHDHVQLSRSSMPWVHGTEIDPWPQIVAALADTAGGGTRPFPARAIQGLESQPMLYGSTAPASGVTPAMLAQNPGLAPGKPTYLLIGTSPGSGARNGEVTQDQVVATAWAKQLGGPILNPGSIIVQVSWGWFVQMHEAAIAPLQIAFTGGGGGSTDLRPVLDAIEQLPTAAENAAAARAAIVKD